jgi:hypothetical protein
LGGVNLGECFENKFEVDLEGVLRTNLEIKSLYFATDFWTVELNYKATPELTPTRTKNWPK